jgi:hypothetical protein
MFVRMGIRLGDLAAAIDRLCKRISVTCSVENELLFKKRSASGGKE